LSLLADSGQSATPFEIVLFVLHF